MADPTYTLPDLAYDYGALEPHISARIMELHHDKHHATYAEVKGAPHYLQGRRREAIELVVDWLRERVPT